jgi:AcrR family transcriptional regulator
MSPLIEDTEQKILESAKEIFQEKGMTGSRMQEIADRAGINKAMLHYYYRSKQLLFEAVFTNVFRVLAPQLNKILNDDSDLFDKIKNFSNNYNSFVIRHPYLPNFVINELNKSPEFIVKLRAEKEFPSILKFKDQVDDYVERGLIKPIKAEQLFIHIMSLNVFPFIADSLLKGLTNTDEKQYGELMEQRKTEVGDFIINSIRIK